MNHAFVEISLVIVLAATMGVFARLLRQPAVLGYIATGLLAGPLGLVRIQNPELIDALAEIGITFLLFLVGIEMRFAELKRVGKTALLAGLGQMAAAVILGFGIARLLGFSQTASVYIGLSLAFASTIVVVKLLSEKHALESLYGKIIVGILLVQDFVALGVLMLLSSLASSDSHSLSQFPLSAIGLIFLKGAILVGTALLLGRTVMPKLMHSVGRSPETLFLVSLAWGMGVAALVSLPFIGFTIEIGGLMAGIALAGSFEHSQIASRVKSLRDFFLVMFFVVLGTKMSLEGLGGVMLPAVALSLYVVIINPLVILLIVTRLGFKVRTAFLAAIAIAQVSEFSLILMTLGARIGHVDQRASSLVTAVALITIAISSYLILHGEDVYLYLKKPLRFFERRHSESEETAEASTLSNHVILIGCHRLGHNILESLKDKHSEFLVVDFNPEVVSKLRARGIRAIYGDAADPEIEERAGVDQARLIISTMPELRDSLQLLKRVRANNPNSKVVMTAENEPDAVHLYKEGADYVILPHFIGGLQLARTIQEDEALSSLKTMREQDLSIIAHHL